MKDNKSKKITIILILLLISVIIIIGTTLAYFRTKIDDTVTGDVGSANVVLEEDYPNTGNNYGEETTTKRVRGFSNAEKEVYVRLNCIPIIELLYEYEEDGETKSEWRASSIKTDDIELTFTGDDWVEQDGFYYYNKILKQNEYTSYLQIDWDIKSIPENISDYDVRLNVKVILEYAQSTNEAWKSIFEIEKLPVGVEESK